MHCGLGGATQRGMKCAATGFSLKSRKTLFLCPSGMPFACLDAIPLHAVQWWQFRLVFLFPLAICFHTNTFFASNKKKYPLYLYFVRRYDTKLLRMFLCVLYAKNSGAQRIPEIKLSSPFFKFDEPKILCCVWSSFSNGRKSFFSIAQYIFLFR